MKLSIERIAVLGAGTMGHGIAQVAAQAGYATSLYDLDAQALERAREHIHTSLAKGLERGKITEEDRQRTLDNLSTTAGFEEALEGADLVIEAVAEDLSVKKELIGRTASVVGERALLASNTSSLSIARIAEAVAASERVIGMHFFNPVPVMKLLEVVLHGITGRGGTSEPTRKAVLEVGRRMGKEPIVVKDSPGFASSRLGLVLGLEAMRMAEQGVASIEDIDKAMQLGYRHPMGPLRLTDLVGLDVRLAIAETLHRELGGAQYLAPEVLRRKVAAGELGQKTGKGFYEWTE